MSDSDLAEYAYLWNPANGWTLSAHYHDCSRVRVHFNGKPTLEELKIARAHLPFNPAFSLQEFFKRYSAAPEIDVGVMSTREAIHVANECKKAGLNVTLQDESYTSYLPFNSKTGMALIIEDDDQAQRVCKRMLENGIPITEIEVRKFEI